MFSTPLTPMVRSAQGTPYTSMSVMPDASPTPVANALSNFLPPKVRHRRRASRWAQQSGMPNRRIQREKLDLPLLAHAEVSPAAGKTVQWKRAVIAPVSTTRSSANSVPTSANNTGLFAALCVSMREHA